jgi:hypothetical protein
MVVEELLELSVWHSDRRHEPFRIIIIYSVLVGVPLLASIINPWTGAVFRRLLG